MDRGCVTTKADIWALDCIIYRIITANPLFAPEGWGSMDDTNIEQIVLWSGWAWYPTRYGTRGWTRAVTSRLMVF